MVSAFERAWNWVDAYLCLVHGLGSELYRFLRQAMVARRVLLLIDGIDEGGHARQRVEQHIVEVLAPQGFVIVVTSRPNGLPEVGSLSETSRVLCAACECSPRRLASFHRSSSLGRTSGGSSSSR